MANDPTERRYVDSMRLVTHTMQALGTLDYLQMVQK